MHKRFTIKSPITLEEAFNVKVSEVSIFPFTVPEMVSDGPMIVGCPDYCAGVFNAYVPRCRLNFPQAYQARAYTRSRLH